MTSRWVTATFFAMLTGVFAMLTGGCGDGAIKLPSLPAAPSAPAPAVPTVPTLTAIRVGVAGNAEAVFEPGQSKQLWALGTYSNGSEGDLTNRALWQTSNPVVATVSAAGVVSAAGFGGAAISASVDDTVGTLAVSVTPQKGCRLTLSPSRLVFGAFSARAGVSVTVNPSDCRWSVSSDASWLPFRFDPGRSGSGAFSYEVPANSAPTPRSANLVVSASGGVTAVHAVEQERPRSCSYVAIPARSQFPRAGGTGTFRVDTTPNDCRWTASISEYQGSILTGQSGTGDGSVTFTVRPTTYSSYGTIQIRGLSGENPPGEHRFEIP
jgi:hypothetical protein